MTQKGYSLSLYDSDEVTPPTLLVSGDNPSHCRSASTGCDCPLVEEMKAEEDGVVYSIMNKCCCFRLCIIMLIMPLLLIVTDVIIQLLLLWVDNSLCNLNLQLVYKITNVKFGIH